MRSALLPVTMASVLLAACGGPQTSQANNTQANMSSSASPPATASASAVQVSTTAVDQATAAKLVSDRKDGMKKLGQAMKSIKRSLDGNPFKLTDIQQAAPPLLDTKAAQIVQWFPAGTGDDVVPKTEAKADIWKNPQDFAAKAQGFQDAAKKFGDAMATGKPDQMKSAFADLGNSCKACHDKYKADKH